MNNQKGITLVELLATIVIAFFAMGIIYSVVILAINYFTAETTKTRLQQETNYIITELQRIHRAGDCYILNITEDSVAVRDCTRTGGQRIVSDQYNYDVNFEKNGQPLDPLDEEAILENFTVIDKENPELQVEVTTVISRFQPPVRPGGEE